MPVIVGVGRSGTTLLRLMLDAHSQMSIPAETGFLPALAELSDGSGAQDPEAFIRTVTGIPNWNDFAVGDEDLRAAVTGLDPFSVGDAARRCYQLYARRHGKPRFGDKTPGYLIEMHSIERLLPEARFIHIIRDGRDVALSLRPLWFSPGKEIGTIAGRWRDWITTGRELAAGRRHYMECRYEELVANPRAILRQVCDFIELPFEERMLGYHEQAAERLNEVQDFHGTGGELIISKEQRLANHRLTSMPPQTSRVGRWRTEMTKEELERFNAVAGDLLAQLGYELPASST